MKMLVPKFYLFYVVYIIHECGLEQCLRCCAITWNDYQKTVYRVTFWDENIQNNMSFTINLKNCSDSLIFVKRTSSNSISYHLLYPKYMNTCRTIKHLFDILFLSTIENLCHDKGNWRLFMVGPSPK